MKAALLSTAVFSHPPAIANCFPTLGSLKQDLLESASGERVLRTALPGTRTFSTGARRLRAMTVEDREPVNGRITETTKDDFAQDGSGKACYMGEAAEA